MKPRTLDDAYHDLQDSYDRWQQLYDNGGQDPFWPDGVNLNLVRNHIIYYRNEIDDLSPTDDRRDIFSRELPHQVDQDYMANADQIRMRAKESLAVMEQDKNYLFLKRTLPKMNPRQASQCCVPAVVGYVTGLERAIAEDDLVSMRRGETPDSYLESFESTAERVRELRPPEQEQLSMFYQSSFDDGFEDGFEDEMTMGM